MVCVDTTERERGVKILKKDENILDNWKANILDNWRVVDIEGIKSVIAYRGHIFLDIEELHQWKIENEWNGIDIAVTKEDILREGEIYND
jgi:hypothetical protein